MRKYAPLLLSFALGVACGLGIQTSTFVQRSLAQAPSTPCPAPPSAPALPDALIKAYGPMLIEALGAIPVVPVGGFNLEGNSTAGIQQLDGMNCKGCVLQAKLITYGGGQFQCERCTIASTNGVWLHGAALNTFRVLQFTGAIPGAPKAEPDNPNR